MCAAEAAVHLARADGRQTAAGLFWAAGGLIAIGWVCMLNLERNRKPDPLPVQQVVNHYVFHGLPGGAHLPLPLPGTAVPGEVVQDPGLPGITAPRRPRAIEAPRARGSLMRSLTARIPVRIVCR